MDDTVKKEEDASADYTGPSTRRKRKAVPEPALFEDVKKEIKVEEDEASCSNLPIINNEFDFLLPVPPEYTGFTDTEIKKELEEWEELELKASDNGVILESALSLFDQPVKKEKSVASTSKAHATRYQARKQAETSQRMFNCGQCKASFEYDYLLDQHYEQKHIVRSHKYPCVKLRPSAVKFLKAPNSKRIGPLRDARDDPTWRGHSMAEGCHYKHKDNTKAVKIDWASPGETYMDCDECGDRFDSVREHRIHVLKDHPDNRKERLCKNRHCVLMRELNRQESVGELVETPEKHHLLTPMFDDVYCPICKMEESMKFTSYWHLYKHYIFAHSKDYHLKFECRACKSSFETPAKLKNHIVQKARNDMNSPCIGSASIRRPWPKVKAALADPLAPAPIES